MSRLKIMQHGMSHILFSLVLATAFGAFVWGSIEYQSKNINSVNQLAAVSALDYSNEPTCYSDRQLSVLNTEKNKVDVQISKIPQEIEKYKTQVSAIQKQLIKANENLKKVESAYNTGVSKFKAEITKQKKALQESTQKLTAAKTPAQRAVIEKQIATIKTAIKKAEDGMNGLINSFTNAKKAVSAFSAQIKALESLYANHLNGTKKRVLTAESQRLAGLIKKFSAYAKCPKSEDQTTCIDKLDNDRDGVVDCKDSDCTNTAACKGVPNTPASNNVSTSTVSQNKPVEVGRCSDGVSGTKAECENQLYTYSCTNPVYFDEASCVADGAQWVAEVLGAGGIWMQDNNGDGGENPDGNNNNGQAAVCGNDKIEPGEECEKSSYAGAGKGYCNAECKITCYDKYEKKEKSVFGRLFSRVDYECVPKKGANLCDPNTTREGKSWIDWGNPCGLLMYGDCSHASKWELDTAYEPVSDNRNTLYTPSWRCVLRAGAVGDYCKDPYEVVDSRICSGVDKRANNEAGGW
ncbi:MAG: hypothetical protein FGM57_00300 [Candidatus Taylorbacteria bacterium]|nr:hypothetical protein [Candidatus Taylorbacteria bacterium]